VRRLKLSAVHRGLEYLTKCLNLFGLSLLLVPSLGLGLSDSIRGLIFPQNRTKSSYCTVVPIGLNC